MTQKLTTDQKVDLVLKKVDIVIESQAKMQKDVTELIELTSSAMNLATVTSDRPDRLEKKKSFIPFTSGAFVA